MATVTSNWVGSPSPAGQMVSNRRAASYANGQAAAFGIVPDEREEQASGVNPGGGGYVSGQVPPAGATAQATGVPRGTSVPTTPTAPASTPPPSGQLAWHSWTTAPQSAPPPPPQPIPTGTNYSPSSRSYAGAAPAFGVDDVETKTSALQAPSAIPQGSIPVGVDTGGAQTNAGGTTKGQAPIPVGGRASPSVAALNQISPGLGDQMDIGGNLLTPTVADLSPALGAQSRALGLEGNLAQERYDYRPGQAPSQARVALDTANADQIRARQLSNLDTLEAAAAGKVASPAEIQLRQAAARNAATNFGAARALGGRSFGGANRAATVANAESQAQTNVEAAVQRAQEQERARQALITALSGTRGQDIGVAESNANLNQAANANNLKSQLDTNQLADQHRLALLKAQLDALGIDTQAGVGAVNAAAKNAATENESKQGIFKLGSSILAM